MENGLENPGKFPGETMNNFIICQANESTPISSTLAVKFFKMLLLTSNESFNSLKYGFLPLIINLKYDNLSYFVDINETETF